MRAHVYRDALKSCDKKLGLKIQLKQARGMEGIIQEALAERLPGAEREVKLSAIGGSQLSGSPVGLVDIVQHGHGIELKVVRLPRLGGTPSTALYDIGQLSSDYWRLSQSEKLESAELVILLYGPLLKEFKSESAIYREFHNRMYVDYMTSLEFGELKTQKHETNRKRQISVIKKMGLTRPCSRKLHPTFREGAFALVSIKVEH